MDLSLPGAFAALCRCGKKVQECVKHVPGDDADRVLLPAGVEPLHYDVALALRFADPPQEYIPCTSIAIGETKGGTPELAHVFDGEVSVTIAVEKQAANVSLHAKDLTIKTASIDGVACAYALDEELSTVTLTPLAPIGKGEHVVALTYEGVLNNLMAGFYRSTRVRRASPHGRSRTTGRGSVLDALDIAPTRLGSRRRRGSFLDSADAGRLRIRRGDAAAATRRRRSRDVDISPMNRGDAPRPRRGSSAETRRRGFGRDRRVGIRTSTARRSSWRPRSLSRLMQDAACRAGTSRGARRRFRAR